jgi:ribosomal protein L14
LFNVGVVDTIDNVGDKLVIFLSILNSDNEFVDVGDRLVGSIRVLVTL